MITLSLLMLLAVSAPAQNFAMPEELGAAVLSARQLGAAAPQAVRNLRGAAPVPVVAAINTGFLALGAAGKTGKVQGPPFGGDGTYSVVQNDPMQMAFDMKTGYVNGRFTLKRDPATGKDTLGFAGQTKDGPFSDWKTSTGTYPGQIAYNSAADSGTIAWTFNGSAVTDTFKGGGRAGSRSMTITLDGNAHTFTQN